MLACEAGTASGIVLIRPFSVDGAFVVLCAIHIKGLYRSYFSYHSKKALYFNKVDQTEPI